MSDVQLNAVEQDDGRERINPAAAAKPVELVKDDGFVAWLNQRMKVAEWDNYQRGSDEFFDIENDLEKLSKSDMDLARKLWKDNTPPGMKLPFYLDPELDKMAGREQSGERKQPGAEKEPQEGPKKAAGDAQKENEYKVPASVRSRYLEAENQFFFRDGKDKKDKMAFEDRGRKMVTAYNDPDVARSLVEIAEAKGWGKIKVTGHDDFKREVWLQAQLKGIEVAGYKPKEVDLARLKEEQAALRKNGIEQDDGRDKSKGKSSERVPDDEKAYQTPGYDKAENFRGKLMEHGRAPYDFDDKNDPNYYVKIETANGTKIHWGVDLGRAMENAASKIGDLIELERLGKRPVTVDEKQFNEAGQFIGTKPIEVERIEWSVNGVDMSKNAAKAPEVATPAPAKTVLVQKDQQPKPEPKLVMSEKMPAAEVDPAYKQQVKGLREMTDLIDGKTAGKAREAKPEQAPVVQAKDAAKDKTSTKAPALTGDFKVAAAVLSKVMKAEGVSPEVLKRVQAKAVEMLNAKAAAGEKAPGVKIYDRGAERERPREKIVSKTKEKQQEKSR